MAESKIGKGIKIVRVFDQQQDWGNNDEKNISFNLPSDFHRSYGVLLSRCWPASNWNNGAVTTIIEDNTKANPPVGQVRLASTSHQIYNYALDLIYI